MYGAATLRPPNQDIRSPHPVRVINVHSVSRVNICLAGVGKQRFVTCRCRLEGPWRTVTKISIQPGTRMGVGGSWECVPTPPMPGRRMSALLLLLSDGSGLID